MKSWAVLGILFLTAAAAQARVEIHLTYIDQEARSLLETEMREHPDIPVLAISSYSLDKKAAFGKWLDEYSSDHPNVVTDANKATGDSVEESVSRTLQQAVGGAAATPELKKLLMPQAKTMSFGSAAFNVAKMNPSTAKSGKDVIIVLQAPEVGRQPQLLQEYLKRALPSLRSLPQAQDGVHLSSFGTAGGVAPESKPGDIDHPDASLFVGAKMVPGSHPPKYFGQIALASTDPKDPTVTLFQSAESESLEAAQFAAIQAFLSLANGPMPAAGGACSTHASALEIASIRDLLKNCMAHHRLTLTTSFFATDAMKTAAAKLGIRDVNMEDFHVIEVVKELGKTGKKFDSVTLSRVITDPPEVPDAAVGRLNQWFSSAKYSKSQMEDAVMWGLRGADLDHPPESAKWGAFSNFSKSSDGKVVNTIHFQTGDAPLDPFYHGVAQNFLYHVGNPKVLEAMVPASQRPAKFSPDEAALQAALKAKANSLRAMSLEIATHPEWSEEQRRGKVGDLLDQSRSMTYTAADGTKTVSLMGLDDGKSFKVPMMVERTLQFRAGSADELAGRLTKSDLERMLYRDALISLSQNATRQVVKDEDQKIMAGH